MDKPQFPKKIDRGNHSTFNAGNLLFPPVVSLPLVLILFITGNSLYATSIPSALWGAVLASYLLLCVAFIAFNRVGNGPAAAAASLVAQGIIFSIFSLSLGSNPALSWVGVAILFVGGVLGIHGFIVPRPITAEDILFSDKTSMGEIEKILDGLPLPALFTAKHTDGKERIAAANREFAELMGQKKIVLKGKPVEEILPDLQTNQNVITIMETKWIAHLTQHNKKTLTLLTPKSEVGEGTSQKIVIDIIDQETGIYTGAFINRKGIEELERCRRYKRKLSVCMISLQCDEDLTEEEWKRAFNLLAGTTGNLIRSCDSAFRMDPDKILLYLPDTPLSGARHLVERIIFDVETLSSIESLMPPMCKIQGGATTYTGVELLTLEGMLQEALEALIKNNAIAKLPEQ